jgi:hypothetical protein
MNILASIARGAILSAIVAGVLAVYRAVDLESHAWMYVLVAVHFVLPVAAAFWARRPDPTTLDVGLAGIGITYIFVLALAPTDKWNGAMYIGLAILYCIYSLLAAAAFHGLAHWRTVLRVRGFARLRQARRQAILSEQTAS